MIGENLAWGTLQLSTPQAIVAAWIASPGHLANILEAQYRETGIGVSPGSARVPRRRRARRDLRAGVRRHHRVAPIRRESQPRVTPVRYSG